VQVTIVYGRKGLQLYPLLLLILDGGDCGLFHAPTALTPGEITPSTHLIGGWVGPRAGEDKQTYLGSEGAAAKKLLVNATRNYRGFRFRRFGESWSNHLTP